VQELELLPADDERPSGFATRSRPCEELRSCDSTVQRQTNVLEDGARRRRIANLRWRAAIRSIPGRRGGSSIDIGSTSGDASSKTRNIALLASE